MVYSLVRFCKLIFKSFNNQPKIEWVFKLTDDLDFFIVFGAVKSPDVKITITRQSKASVIFQIELFREIIFNSKPFYGVFLRLLL